MSKEVERKLRDVRNEDVQSGAEELRMLYVDVLVNKKLMDEVSKRTRGIQLLEKELKEKKNGNYMILSRADLFGYYVSDIVEKHIIDRLDERIEELKEMIANE